MDGKSWCLAWMVSALMMMNMSLETGIPNPKFTAMYVFGDSLMDPGNNNDLIESLAKANYFPYGIDFPQGPTGRFCNGRTFIDYLVELLGLPLLPAYTSSSATGKNIIQGINYASAAAGILEETGRNLGERFTFSEQIQNFGNTLNQLKSRMEEEELRNHLANALVVMAIGSNDYINNYLQPSFYATSSIYNPRDYADLLIHLYSKQIMALQGWGLKKFLLAGVGPLGCVPNRLAIGLGPNQKCLSFDNNVVEIFNERLRTLVDELNANYPGSIFVYGNTFAAFTDILRNASRYGFSTIDKGCCGIGRNRGQITCLPLSIPCSYRNEYVFWDAFHPTEAVNHILAQRAYSGPPLYCYPLNLEKMAQI